MTDRLDITAHHEAAHAVVLYRTAGFAGGHVTIVPDPLRQTLGEAINAIGDSFNEEHALGEIVSAYAGGHSDRKLGFDQRCQCEQDEAIAAEQLRCWGWEFRQAEFRKRSRQLVEQHWPEIVAVAEELLRVQTLDDVEAETIADIAAGSPEVTREDLERYRALKSAQPRALTWTGIA